MKTSKLICITTAVIFFFTAGISSSAFCQKKVETEKSKAVSPQELRGLSPQPEPPDRNIKIPRSHGKKSATPCTEPPDAQVVNNSGLSIYRVKIGHVEFVKNLSRCFDGCSTGFKNVRSGRNQISVKMTSRSAWKMIGTVGRFENSRHYAVNILKKKGDMLCVQLAVRHQTDSTYNDDRTKEVFNNACTRLEKDGLTKFDPGKREPGKKDSKITPKMIKQNKKVFLKFSEEARDITIYNDKAGKIQQFKKGRQFDITESIKKSKGKNIKVIFFRGEMGRGISEGASSVEEDPISSILPTLKIYKDLSSLLNWLRNVDNAEPENDNIIGSFAASRGRISGEVGGDDAADYIKFTTGTTGFGTYVQVNRTSGSVNLHLYDPARRYLDWDANKVWIALAPGATFYVQIEPRGSASTEYELNIDVSIINDGLEPNDSFTQAKSLSSPGNSVLCNVFTSAGGYIGIRDYYKFNLTEEKLVRVSVSNAGLESGKRVSISFYDEDNTHHLTEEGSNNGAVIEYDLRGLYSADWPPFPAGQWRILVSTHSPDDTRAYGTGDGPECYTDPTGYTLDLDLID